MAKIENTPKIVQSKFSGHYFYHLIDEEKYNFRILKMTESCMIYIGLDNMEYFNDIAVAMPTSNDSTISTLIMGQPDECVSQELAQQLSKRLNKIVFFACNVPPSKLAQARKLLIWRLVGEITEYPEFF